MKEMMLLLFFLVVLPMGGALAGLWLARPPVLSGKLALILAGLPLVGLGLAKAFC
ncbi:MAG: hypothetical protein ACYDH9_14215 [Limisphaerales bacterium]